MISPGRVLGYSVLAAITVMAPSGSRGVIFTPWLAEKRSLKDDHGARAGFTNASLASGTAELVRSTMEGVAANSRWPFGFVEKLCGREFSSVGLVGGGAQSALWCQIFADALDWPVEQVRDSIFAEMRGMAAVVSVALGRQTLTDVQTNHLLGRGFEPAPEGVEAMARLSDEAHRIFEEGRPRSNFSIEWRDLTLRFS